MHIAIDARIINTSTGRYVERLVHYLQQIDTTNTYTILVPSKDLVFVTLRNPNFTLLAADFDNYSFEEQTKFKRFLDNLAPDLVHFCMPQQPILYKGGHVTTIHDLTLLQTYNSDKNWLIFHAKQLVGRFVFKRVAQSSKFILTPTQHVKNDLQKFVAIPDEKIVVTYEAADTAPGALQEYSHPFKQFLLYVGQQSDYKNIKRLCDAHQQLLQTHPDLGLILVGRKNASVQKHQRYVENMKDKNILFTGFVEDSQRDWLFTHTAAYIFPSLMEGFGLPGLEAMAYGAPVVSSSATCLPEVYGEAAHYFDPRDTYDMVRAINEVLVDDDLKNKLINNGHTQLGKYSWHRMATQTHDVYMKALRK